MSPWTHLTPQPGLLDARPAPTSRSHPRRGRSARRRLCRPRRRGRRSASSSRATARASRSGASRYGAGPRLVVRLRPRWPAGQRYNLRATGAWDPDGGLRHNPAKLLPRSLRPRRRGRGRGGVPRSTATSSTPPGTATASSLPTSTAGATCRGASSSTTPSTGRTTGPPGTHPARPSSTRRTCAARRCSTPGVPEELRGTYAGLGAPGIPRSTSPRSGSRPSSCSRCMPSPTSRTWRAGA